MESNTSTDQTIGNAPVHVPTEFSKPSTSTTSISPAVATTYDADAMDGQARPKVKQSSGENNGCDNLPISVQAIKATRRDYAESGSSNTSLCIESARTVSSHIETHVNKSQNLFINPIINIKSDASATTDTSKKEQVISQCCKINDRDINKLCYAFKEKLKKHYSKLVLPKVAWLNTKGHDLSLAEHSARLQLTKTKEIVKIEEIFKSVNNEIPIRILIEGQPGYGKTALATKLAFDWATDKQYINNYKFAFFIPLREIQQQSIEDAFVQTAINCGFKDSCNVIQMINHHEKETLFIMDGLDEISLDKRDEIMKILFNQTFGQVTVVVTCRTGLFELSKDEHRQLFGSTSMSCDFSDKQISLLGIQSLKEKREFLCKFMSADKVFEIDKCLSIGPELFDSPLFLKFLTLTFEHDTNNDPISSVTMLYKKLFNSVLKHTCFSCGRDIGNDFDLFRLNSSPNAIQKAVRDFGMSSLQKLVEKDLKFESDDLTIEIYNLGFLILHREMTSSSSQCYYEAFHLSIIEFAAAFAVWMDFKFQESTLSDNVFEPVVNSFVESNGTSRVLPFITNLMGDDLDQLLRKLNSFRHWFQCHFQLTMQLSLECSHTSIFKSKYLQEFIPSHIFMKIAGSSGNIKALKALLDYGIKCGKIKTLEICKKMRSELISHQIVNCLQLNLIMTKDVNFFAWPNVPCKLQDYLSCCIPFDGTMSECLHFIASSQVESCLLKCYNSSSSAKFLQLIMKEKTFSKIRYRYLKIKITTDSEKEMITKLIENNQVQDLHLHGHHKLDMSKFSVAAAHSTNLSRLTLRNLVIDFHCLTNGRTKYYDSLAIKGCILTCKQQLSTNCCSDMFIENLFDIGAMSSIKPSRFGAFCSDMEYLMENYPDWPGFTTVNYFSLCVHSSQVFKTNYISCFKNLQTLCIRLANQSDEEELIAKCIYRLPIVKLIVQKVFEDFRSKLFKYMNDLWAKEKNSHLTTIEFAFLHTPESEVRDLMEGLGCNHWDLVHLISGSHIVIRIGKYISNYSLTHYNLTEKIAQKETDIDYYFYFYTYRCNNLISITKE